MPTTAAVGDVELTKKVLKRVTGGAQNKKAAWLVMLAPMALRDGVGALKSKCSCLQLLSDAPKSDVVPEVVHVAGATTRVQRSALPYGRSTLRRH